jgi:uncharacterized phage infection (PIP) family protein YhgE
MFRSLSQVPTRTEKELKTYRGVFLNLKCLTGVQQAQQLISSLLPVSIVECSVLYGHRLSVTSVYSGVPLLVIIRSSVQQQ